MRKNCKKAVRHVLCGVWILAGLLILLSSESNPAEAADFPRAKRVRSRDAAVVELGRPVGKKQPPESGKPNTLAEPASRDRSDPDLPEVSFSEVMEAARTRVRTEAKDNGERSGTDFVRAKAGKGVLERPRAGGGKADPVPASFQARELKRLTVFKNWQYVKYALPSWGSAGRYAWIVYDRTARPAKEITLYLYCHGMHSVDYHRAFAHGMRGAKKSTRAGTVFAGLRDMPDGRGNWNNRWEEFDGKMGRGPELIFAVFRELEAAVRRELPAVKRVRFVLSGHSGGHRVLDNVSRMLLSGRHPRDTAWLMERLDRVIHFDVWYEDRCVDYVPKMLERWPSLRIYSTVNHAGPARNAVRLAKKLSLKPAGNGWNGYGGRLKIRRGKNHWRCVADYMAWSLEE